MRTAAHGPYGRGVFVRVRVVPCEPVPGWVVPFWCPLDHLDLDHQRAGVASPRQWQRPTAQCSGPLPSCTRPWWTRSSHAFEVCQWSFRRCR